MGGKVIPFRINVNSGRHWFEDFGPPDNSTMEQQTVEQALADLALERGMDVFHTKGRLKGQLNQNKLAAVLTLSAGERVDQSLISKLKTGKIKVKNLDRLKPIANGYKISLNDFLRRVRPDFATAPLTALPPEAAELWALWSQLPRQLRSHFTEQIKNAIAFKQRFPELADVVSGEALQAANAVRIERQRKRKPGAA